jgi:hypothetical protein
MTLCSIDLPLPQATVALNLKTEVSSKISHLPDDKTVFFTFTAIRTSNLIPQSHSYKY